MTDGAGVYKSEFLILMRAVLAESQEKHADIVNSFRAAVLEFLAEYRRAIGVINITQEDFGDFLNEMEKLASVLEKEPRNDGEVYDQRVAMVRLGGLIKTTLDYAVVESDLKRRIRLGKFDSRKFIF